MLCGFGFEFFGRSDDRQPGYMDVKAVLTPHIASHLTQGFQKRERFNITYGATDLDEDYFSAGGLGDQTNPAFDFISDMWNHLDGTTQVVPTAFFCDHFFIDLSGSHITNFI